MTSLYVCILMMLLAAIGLLTSAGNPLSKPFGAVCCLLTIFSLSLYWMIQPVGLSTWLQSGKKHYQLLAQFQQLGGIKGAIASVKAKLANDPNDKQAWILLGKLYLANHEEAAARSAFAKAKSL